MVTKISSPSLQKSLLSTKGGYLVYITSHPGVLWWEYSVERRASWDGVMDKPRLVLVIPTDRGSSILFICAVCTTQGGSFNAPPIQDPLVLAMTIPDRLM